MADEVPGQELNGVVIRKGVPEDAAALAEFGWRTFAESFAAQNDPQAMAEYLSENYSTSRQSAELSSPDVLTLLAELDGHLIGYAQVRRNPPPTDYSLPDPLELHRIYIDSPYHGSGVAQRLMAAVLSTAPALGGRTLWLSVWEQNPRAIHFYAKYGFQDLGSKDFWLGNERQTDRLMAISIEATEMENPQTFKAAVVQAAPVLFDREATVEKACRLTAEAAANGAQVILFPEAFIPAYPRGLGFGTVVGSRSPQGRLTWQAYWESAVDVPSPVTEALGAAARAANAYLAVGVIEREGHGSRGTLYCTLLYFDPAGELVGLHRKLKPTAAERLIWGEGDGSTLAVVDSPYGRLGGLICWENYMPLARMAMYAKGVELYLAPTADSRDSWQATLRHIACEGRCFVLGCNQFVTKDMYPPDLPGLEDLDGAPDILCRGGSAIISPLGEVLAGPLYDQEGILYADLDPAEIARSKFDFDVTGHYARPDVFTLTVDESPKRSVSFNSPNPIDRN